MAVCDTTTAFGIVTSSDLRVLNLVDSTPICVIVPSTSPILTTSPSLSAREYVSVTPLIT